MKTLALIATLGSIAGVALATAAPDAPAPPQTSNRGTAPARDVSGMQTPTPRLFKAAPPALRSAPQKEDKQGNQPSLMTVEKIPSQTGVTPGIYLASPYTGIVVVPPDIDPKFTVGVGDSRLRMPGVEPPLTLKPRNQPAPKPAEGPATPK